MSKFTPGPWGIDEDVKREDDVLIFNTNGLKTVCLVHNHSNTASDVDGAINEAWGNAHLISACPEMYEACQLAINRIQRLCFELYTAGISYDETEVISKLQGAIEKAEGK